MEVYLLTVLKVMISLNTDTETLSMPDELIVMIRSAAVVMIPITEFVSILNADTEFFNTLNSLMFLPPDRDRVLVICQALESLHIPLQAIESLLALSLSKNCKLWS